MGKRARSITNHITLGFSSAILSPFYMLAKGGSLTVFLLIMIISLSPRLHLGTLAYGKLLDLRFEDFFLVLILLSLFIYHAFTRDRKIYVSPLGKPILLYLLLAFVSTAIGLYLGWIEAQRAFLFYLKEVEFFLIFLLIVNFVKTMAHLKVALATFLIGGLINGFYIVYQFAVGNVGGLGNPGSLYRYYGVSMVGETSPVATGNYFSLLFILSLGLLVMVSNRKVKLISLVGILLSILGMVGSLIRTSVWGTAIVLPLYCYFLLKQSSSRNRLRVLVFLVFLLPILALVGQLLLSQMQSEVGTLAQRIVNIGNLTEKYYIERVVDVYADYFKVIPKSPIIGLGKSITGQQEIPGVSLTRFYGEAHNNYLRILTEMGIIGLFAFLYLVFSVARLSYLVFRNSEISLGRVVGLTCFIYTAFLVVASFAQDVFVIARTIELYWILVGLVIVVYKWNREKLA